MNYIKTVLIPTLILLFTISCDRDLPYPLDDVKQGVVIDITKVAGTDGVLSAGTTDGNFQLKLTIPKQQGDYSNLERAELLCIFTSVTGEVTSKVIKSDISTFPAIINIDLAQVYESMGHTVPELKEVLTFTTNVVLKDGTVITGWNKITGFNNKSFSSWQIDGRDYSYNAEYPVVCPLFIDDFVGTATIVDPFWEEDYDVTLTKVSETELKLTGFLTMSEPEGILHIVIDPTSHTISIKKTVVVPAIWGYTNLSIQATGTIDACNNKLKFTGAMSVDQGGFGSFNFVVTMH